MWSCMIGLAINASGITLPKVVMLYTDMLGKASLSAGLLVVGAGLGAAPVAGSSAHAAADHKSAATNTAGPSARKRCA